MSLQSTARSDAALMPAQIAGGVERTQVTLTETGAFWLEHRFDEGRACVMRVTSAQPPRAVTPAGVDVGTLAWEYGGGSYLPAKRGLVYVDRDDQRLYRIDPGGAPVALTAAPAAPCADRFADGSLSPDGRWAAYVRESHRSDGSVEHAVVAITLEQGRLPRVLAYGHDFYAAPRISPDGRQIAWICWNKPNMPWDGSELWVAPLHADGTPGVGRRVAGGPTESVLQPSWSPAGQLHWVSDRSGWWNLETLDRDGVRTIAPQAAEFAAPPWEHGITSYGFLADGTIVAVRARDAVHQLVRIDPSAGRTTALGPPLTAITGPHISCHDDRVLLVGATATEGPAVIAVDASSGRSTTLAADAPAWEDRLVSIPVPLWIPRKDGTRTHAFLHQPSRVPAGSSRTGPPPLILNLHGGPTDSAPLSLQPELLLWTSRGFAVLDLNYSGSSGFGRAYRERLYEAWGDADLADCLAAVRWLVADGVVDGRRVFVRGGSAGGYLTLQCLAHSRAFRGGMCRCGIADLATWRNDAHDFESRYTDLLVGRPSESARYAERSPARHVGTQAAPVLIVHGQADAVVPPGHARAIADSYRRAGRPHRVVLLDGEPHGFRRADSRARWLGVELDFAASLVATAP